jgi:anti-sigma factor RsiW
MTTLDRHDQLRSLLADIGDAAGEPRGLPSANGSRSQLPAPRPRAGRLLAAAAAVVLVVAGAIAVWQHTPSSDTSGDVCSALEGSIVTS